MPDVRVSPAAQHFIDVLASDDFAQQPLTQHLSLHAVVSVHFAVHPHVSPHMQSVQQQTALAVFPAFGVTVGLAENAAVDSIAATTAAALLKKKNDRFIQSLLIVRTKQVNHNRKCDTASLDPVHLI